jgi:hypothetical protein
MYRMLHPRLPFAAARCALRLRNAGYSPLTLQEHLMGGRTSSSPCKVTNQWLSSVILNVLPPLVFSLITVKQDDIMAVQAGCMLHLFASTAAYHKLKTLGYLRYNKI